MPQCSPAATAAARSNGRASTARRTRQRARCRHRTSVVRSPPATVLPANDETRLNKIRIAETDSFGAFTRDHEMTTLTAAPSRAGVRATKTNFYFYMALSCAAVAFLGFAPTFWFPLATHSFKANPIVYVHGTVFFAWTLFFCFQTWLAASGRVMNHRAVGLIGISFATAMTIFGTLAAINSMKMAALGGMKDEGIAFAIVPLSGIAFFAVVFALAVIKVRDGEAHKRL